MEDRLIIAYDNCSPDTPTLLVARKDKYDMTIINKIQGNSAAIIYGCLTGTRELKSAKDFPRKPKGDYDSVPHHRCPTCNNAVRLYEDDPHFPHCQWCGQALLWETMIGKM